MTETMTFSLDAELETTEDPRVLSALVLPFNEVGSNANGEFIFSAGTVTLPADPAAVALKIQHDGEASKIPVGHGVSFEETEAGVVGKFRILPGLVGDRLLEDHSKGNKKSISPEFTNVLRNGKNVVSAVFSAAAAVVVGGFPSAVFFAAGDPVEAEAGDSAEASALTPDESGDIAIEATETPATVTVTAGETSTTFTPLDKEEDANVSIPNTFNAGDANNDAPLSAREAFALLASRASGKGGDLNRINEALTPSAQAFALAPVKHSGTGAVVAYNPAPQWIGEIWDGNKATPVISDLLGSKDLTGRTVAGFKFTTPPTGGPWAGNGAAITSTAIATTPYSYTASYWAGGNTFAREFTDFGVSEELFSLYFAAQTQNFQLWLDGLALDGINSGAQIITADNPAGVTIGAGFSALIDGVSQVIANKAGVPTFALVKASLYKQMLKTPQASVLGYLNAALGLTEGTLDGFQIRPVDDAAMGAKSVLVGVKQGADLYTLAGSPVRAEALQVSTGQIDVGLYGYGLFVPNKANAFVSVLPFTA